jgi:hypothetical protein
VPVSAKLSGGGRVTVRFSMAGGRMRQAQSSAGLQLQLESGAVIDATIVATGEDFIVAEPAAFETVAAAAAAAAVPIAVRYGMADKPCEMLQCASLQ